MKDKSFIKKTTAVIVSITLLISFSSAGFTKYSPFTANSGDAASDYYDGNDSLLSGPAAEDSEGGGHWQ